MQKIFLLFLCKLYSPNEHVLRISLIMLCGLFSKLKFPCEFNYAERGDETNLSHNLCLKSAITSRKQQQTTKKINRASNSMRWMHWANEKVKLNFYPPFSFAEKASKCIRNSVHIFSLSSFCYLASSDNTQTYMSFSSSSLSWLIGTVKEEKFKN